MGLVNYWPWYLFFYSLGSLGCCRFPGPTMLLVSPPERERMPDEMRTTQTARHSICNRGSQDGKGRKAISPGSRRLKRSDPNPFDIRRSFSRDMLYRPPKSRGLSRISLHSLQVELND